MKNSMYNEYALEYAQAIKNNTFNAHYERPSLLSLLPELQGKSILDLGCGPGEQLEFFLNEKCSHITAIDVSQSMVKIVKERYGANVDSYKQNLNMGIPNEKDSIYDIVVSGLTIHYIKNISFLFKEIFRVLKKNGLFVFSTHHPHLDFSDSESFDYFKTEKLTQTWHTLGKPVEVSFYRRPLSKTFNALSEAGFYITYVSEGKASKELKSISGEDYNRLTKRPFFIFVKCQKIK